MSYDLQQFKDTYITECNELLTEMEDRLLKIDAGNASKEELNAIFRCAHSIKGGAGAFGFTAIAQFTHILEALLDQMREGEIPISREVADTLLRARDVVVQMVAAAAEGKSLPPEFGQDVAHELASYSPLAAASQKTAGAAKKEAEQKGPRQYQIRFKPHPHILQHGNDPLLILRELSSLGKMEATADLSRLPPLEKLNPEECYLSWNITLESEESPSRIREVFEFVEDECDLTIECKEEAQAPTAPAQKKEGAPPAENSTAAPTATSIRVDIDKVDRLINMVGEVVITQAMLTAQTRELPAQQFSVLLNGINELQQHTRELQEAVMAIRMQPVKSIFSRMPRLVRDLSQQLKKDIRLEMKGEDTEVDKTIIEQLSDPLTHMIRNSVDHGVEQPEVRTRAGKPAQGVITLTAAHQGGRIVIEVADDGSGLNREKILKKAKEKAIIAPDANLPEGEIDNLIFAAGFSTAETVSNVSGRGVGMDVVKRNIEGLGGSVHIRNNPGQGAAIAISLPLTLAILDGMIVRSGQEFYIVPIANIIETMRPKEDEVKHTPDGSALIRVRGEFIPVLYLYRCFGIDNAIKDASQALVVLVEAGQNRFGLVVDELVGQQQVVIKSLEDNADRIEGVSGATILGDGKVSLILDTSGLYRMQQRFTEKRAA